MPLHIVALRVDFFFRTVFIQDPAHINNCIFPLIAFKRLLLPVSPGVSCVYVYTRTSMQFYGPHAGAVISQKRALTDKPMSAAHLKQLLAPCSRASDSTWEKESHLFLCSTDYLAWAKIKREDLWEQEEHG